MKATRADVARLAGVSTATVSYVLNGSKPITPETTRRVMEAVRQLDYQPDFIARSMSTKQSKQIAIFLDNISNPLYGGIIAGFEEQASASGYYVSVCASQSRFQEYFTSSISRRIDGLFIMAPPRNYGEEALNKVADHGIRVITSGYFGVDKTRFSSIESDYLSAMGQAMRRLYERGHREIAFLTGLSRTMGADTRAKGYLDMVGELGLASGDDLLIDGTPGSSTEAQDGYALARRLIARGKRFTAAICVNDLTAIGAYTAFHEARLSIPEDVAVVGCDDIDVSRFLTPSLTTLSLNKADFGMRAFRLLHKNITTGQPQSELGQLALVERQSTNAFRQI